MSQIYFKKSTIIRNTVCTDQNGFWPDTLLWLHNIDTGLQFFLPNVAGSNTEEWFYI